MLDVRVALARHLGRPELIEQGRLVRQNDGGRLSALRDQDLAGCLHAGDQLLMVGIDLAENPCRAEVPEAAYRAAEARRAAQEGALGAPAAAGVPPAKAAWAA